MSALSTLREVLRYREPGYQFTRLFKLHKWDGWRSLLVGPADDGTFIFPAGLLPRVRRVLAPFAYTQTSAGLDAPDPDGPCSPLPDGTVLYEDQVSEDQGAAVRRVHQQRRGLFALATNYGKTTFIAGLLYSYRTRKALVIVDSRGLLGQTADELARMLCEPVGQYGDGRRHRGQRVVVATIQTLRSRLTHPHTQELLQRPLLVVDECHCVTPGWFPVLAACPAPIRVGLSGTAREARVPVIEEAFLGPILVEVKQTELVAAGRSATPYIYMPYTGSAVAERGYGEEYERAIVRNTQRNAVLVEIVARLAAEQLRALLLVYRRPHGEALARALERERGLRVTYLHGQNMSPGALKQVKREMSERQLDCIVATTVFNKGIDIPDFEVLVNAAGWKAPRATIQKLGRGVRRKKDGPNRLIVIDPYDLGNHKLKAQAKQRAKTYTQQGFPPVIGTVEQVVAALVALFKAQPHE